MWRCSILWLCGGCRALLGLETPTLADDASVTPDGTLDTRPDSPPGCYGSSTEDLVCFFTPPEGAVTLDAVAINTDSSPLCSKNVRSGPFACVIAGNSVWLHGTVRAVGSRPLVVVATETLVVPSAATLDVASHRGGIAGAGASPTACGIPGSADGASGGAGGTLGGIGGAGGKDSNNNTYGTPAAPTPIVGLRGGCSGGRGASGGSQGAGGGAVLLIASHLTIDGVINASGAGGLATSPGGGGGGGSGGMIVLDASVIDGAGIVFANGGGGAGGSSTATGTAGSDPAPTAPTAPAAGGGGVSGANGGSGGAGANAAGGAGTASEFLGGGGGGGGGAGVIVVFAAPFTTGTVSPSP